MKKQCTKCKKSKKLSEFYKKATGKFGFQPTCKDCSKIENLKQYKRIKIEKPWLGSFYSAKGRCDNPDNKDYIRYGAKGIKFLLTEKRIIYLWNRDKAYILDNPSLHRKDPKKNYEISNCSFIELALNSKIGNSRKVYQYDLCDNLIKTWFSRKQVKEEFPLNLSLLNKAIKYNKKYKDHFWSNK